MHCDQCVSGNHNLCGALQQTIVNRYGGAPILSDVIGYGLSPLSNDLESSKAGPLLCGGVTVFTPIHTQVRPRHRVGVIGMGGLGHLAVQFLNKWGCEVTAFTSSSGKEEEAKKLGAHHVIHSRDDSAMQNILGTLDFILNSTNANLNWQSYLDALAPNGVFHNVGGA